MNQQNDTHNNTPTTKPWHATYKPTKQTPPEVLEYLEQEHRNKKIPFREIVDNAILKQLKTPQTDTTQDTPHITDEIIQTAFNAIFERLDTLEKQNQELLQLTKNNMQTETETETLEPTSPRHPLKPHSDKLIPQSELHERLTQLKDSFIDQQVNNHLKQLTLAHQETPETNDKNTSSDLTLDELVTNDITLESQADPEPETEPETGTQTDSMTLDDFQELWLESDNLSVNNDTEPETQQPVFEENMNHNKLADELRLLGFDNL